MRKLVSHFCAAGRLSYLLEMRKRSIRRETLRWSCSFQACRPTCNCPSSRSHCLRPLECAFCARASFGRLAGLPQWAGASFNVSLTNLVAGFNSLSFLPDVMRFNSHVLSATYDRLAIGAQYQLTVSYNVNRLLCLTPQLSLLLAGCNFVCRCLVA